jgi:hypothetical protein
MILGHYSWSRLPAMPKATRWDESGSQDGVVIRGPLMGSGQLALGGVLSLVGYHVGQELQGAPAVALLVGVSVMVIGTAWWWSERRK